MNIAQIKILASITSREYIFHQDNPAFTDLLYASPTDAAGGRAGENARKQDQDIEASQASDDKREKEDNTGRAQGEDIRNQAKDQKEDASITEPDTNLTGDTGNLDIGQTDLGASGTGAEDL